MAGAAFQDADVLAVMAKYQPILVADTDAKYDEASGRYGIEGFPTIVFADPEGMEYERSAGYAGADDFRTRAQQALDAMAEDSGE